MPASAGTKAGITPLRRHSPWMAWPPRYREHIRPDVRCQDDFQRGPRQRGRFCGAAPDQRRAAGIHCCPHNHAEGDAFRNLVYGDGEHESRSQASGTIRRRGTPAIQGAM
jgi:hypothetical protein